MQGDFRIGSWVVQPRINSVQHEGTLHHLEPKVMQVLVVLAAEPGEVITRESLRKAVWPDVFVGEDVLIRAISEIRRVFSDDPKNPHTVQTVPKVGYRLIAPVTIEPSKPRLAEPSKHSDSDDVVSAPVIEPGTVVPPPVSRLQPFWLLTSLSALIVVAIIGLVILNVRTAGSKLTPYTSRPLTTYPGSELQPSFSPDGSAVAFVWRKENERGHVYVLSLKSEVPIRLTGSADEEYSPVWSPDGGTIGLIQQSSERATIQLIPAVGGSEREVYEFPVNQTWEYGGLAWSADGKNLIFPQQEKAGATSNLVELDLATHDIHELTSAPGGWDGDWTPSVSPDGKTLAFVRSSERSVRDLYAMSLNGGSPKALTTDGKLIVGITWTADSKSIVFSSNRGGQLALWKIDSTGGEPAREPVGTDDAYGPTISRQGDRMAFASGYADWSISGLDLGTKQTPVETDILSSTEQDEAPSASPGGDRLVLQSWRSGEQEIWSSDISGRNPIQLTSAGASAGSPNWSPDGKLIAFDARPDSFAHIFIMDATGGAPKALTHGKFNDIVPSWSPDGKWLYFGSNRSGAWAIWKLSADGSGSPVQVTKEGMVAKSSLDGKWLYYTRFVEPGIFRQPLAGGPEAKISEGPPADRQGYWTVGEKGIYTIKANGHGYDVVLLDPDSGRFEKISALQHSPTLFAGMTLEPRDKRLILSEMNHAGSHLTLVDRFH